MVYTVKVRHHPKVASRTFGWGPQTVSNIMMDLPGNLIEVHDIRGPHASSHASFGRELTGPSTQLQRFRET